MADDTDLPLVSNVDDILVKHYLFDFSCNFANRCLTYSLVLFLEPVINAGDVANCKCNSCDKEECAFITEAYINDHSSPENVFVLVLDCHKMTVENVEEINVTFSERERFKYAQYRPSSFCSKGKLKFVTDKWSLKIWKNTSTCKFCFPQFIRISYKTLPEGPSLLWVTDQDKK